MKTENAVRIDRMTLSRIRDAQERHGLLSYGQVIIRALVLLDLIDDARAQGETLLIRRKDGTLERIWMP